MRTKCDVLISKNCKSFENNKLTTICEQHLTNIINNANLLSITSQDIDSAASFPVWHLPCNYPNDIW